MFYINLLLPGIAVGFHAAALGVNRLTINRYQREARAAANDDPALSKGVSDRLLTLTAADGLAMARCRAARSHLPFWSRMAMREYRRQGYTARQLARMFHCSVSAAHRAIAGRQGGFDPLSAARRLPLNQINPPGKRGSRRSPGIKHQTN